jgi:hypothetical protein
MNSSLEIHRLLDEAFAGIDMTPEAQDLKEEMRGNLVARVADLEASGVAPGNAAQRAVAELGDVRSVVDDTSRETPASPWRRNKVRPRPGYVVRTVVVSLLGVAALAVLALLIWKSQGSALIAASALVAALAGGFIVGDALSQETTTNYPTSRGRAAGYGIATGLALAGLGIGAGYLPDHAMPWLVAGGALLLSSIVMFTYLGATQTNRHKPWVLRQQAGHDFPSDGFAQDPASAARFGMYTVSIWLLAIAGFVVLTVTVGWAWSWLVLVVAAALWMSVLARMLFPRADAKNTRGK